MRGGRLHWYDSYLFGRGANLAIHRIGKRAGSSAKEASLDASSLKFLVEHVDIGAPMELSSQVEATLLVFTDEPDLMLRDFEFTSENTIYCGCCIHVGRQISLPVCRMLYRQ